MNVGWRPEVWGLVAGWVIATGGCGSTSAGSSASGGAATGGKAGAESGAGASAGVGGGTLGGSGGAAGSGGASDAAADAPDDGAGGGSFADSPCGKCVQQVCSAFFAECSQVPDCKAYLDCYLACPQDPGAARAVYPCASACPHPTSDAGKLALSIVDDCRGGMGPQGECAAICTQ
jgi:hypothetical protein